MNGKQGEVLANLMKTVVQYGNAFGADKLVNLAGKADKAICSDGDNKDLVGKDITGAVLRLPQTIGSTTGDPIKVHADGTVEVG